MMKRVKINMDDLIYWTMVVLSLGTVLLARIIITVAIKQAFNNE